MGVVFNALLFGFVVVLAGLVEVRCVVYCFVVEFVVWGFGFVGWLRGLDGCLLWFWGGWVVLFGVVVFIVCGCLILIVT